jgi:hypothetical protein
MKLIDLDKLVIGDTFLAHGNKVRLKSYRHDKNIAGYMETPKEGKSITLFSHDITIEYIKDDGSVVLVVSQHPKPEKLELPEYQTI